MSTKKSNKKKPSKSLLVTKKPPQIIQNHLELVIPDVHVPFHNAQAYNLMLRIAKASKIDGITILGDFGDFYGAGGHGNTPGVEKDLKWEIREVNKKLNELDKLFPEQKKVFIQGNHEWRLERYIANNAEELDGIITSESVLDMQRRIRDNNWTWIPYTPDQLTRIAHSKLFARHEPLMNGVHVAHGSVVKAGCSIIFGHTHRHQQSQVSMANGDQHIGISSGWLGDYKNKVFSYTKGFNQWAIGFTFVTVKPNGHFFADFCPILEDAQGYYTHFAGKEWR